MPRFLAITLCEKLLLSQHWEMFMLRFEGETGAGGGKGNEGWGSKVRAD